MPDDFVVLPSARRFPTLPTYDRLSRKSNMAMMNSDASISSPDDDQDAMMNAMAFSDKENKDKNANNKNNSRSSMKRGVDHLPHKTTWRNRTVLISLFLAVVTMVNIWNAVRWTVHNDGDTGDIENGQGRGLQPALKSSITSTSGTRDEFATVPSSSSVKKKTRATNHITKRTRTYKGVQQTVVLDTLHHGQSSTTTTTTTDDKNSHNRLVSPHDYIYERDLRRYDAAPIVVPEYKLVFFSVPKVACTTFKFLFRRIKGYRNWDNQDGAKVMPHNPTYNGLTYLWDYSIEDANAIMTNPEWTRAIFVRDPKLRFLSAFLDKAISAEGWHVLKTCCHPALQCKGLEPPYDDGRRASVVRTLLKECHHDDWDSRKNVLKATWYDDIPCCRETKECRDQSSTMEGFLTMIETCQDEHWDPQNKRMEAKYWNQINFVGHMETMKEDTQRLLEKIGAWEKWGVTGWGPYGNSSIVDMSEFSQHQSHTTGANYKVYQWYTPEKERMVESFFAADYNNPLFNFTITNLTQHYKPPVDGDLLKHNDKIYSKGDWDGAPVVVEKHKLLFFTLPEVGGTTWKQAFRRMEGFDDWKTLWEQGLPHDPATNGLKYLYDYPIDQAEAMMTSPEWTRAIFIMSPKDRFLSVFHQLSRDHKFIDRRCCPHHPGCSSTIRSMPRFVEFMQTCYSTHWAPLTERMEEKWWPYINFIGSLESSEEDSKRLLEKVGAWDEVGATGWGETGEDRIFAADEHTFDNVREGLAMYTPEVGKMLDRFYKEDYESKFFTVRSKGLWIMSH